MKLSKSLKTFALVLAAGSIAFSGVAMADDDDHHHRRHHDDNGDVVLGIIGGVVAGAVEAEQAKKEARELERRCVRLRHECREGSDWACGKYEDICGD